MNHDASFISRSYYICSWFIICNSVVTELLVNVCAPASKVLPVSLCIVTSLCVGGVLWSFWGTEFVSVTVSEDPQSLSLEVLTLVPGDGKETGRNTKVGVLSWGAGQKNPASQDCHYRMNYFECRCYRMPGQEVTKWHTHYWSTLRIIGTQ